MPASLYRGFDRAALDREYNARESVPSFEAEYERYVEMSARAKSEIPHEADIVYEENSGATLDLYPGLPGAPVFLWIHGGYWRASSKDDNAFVAPGLHAHGLSVAVMNYTLAPQATLDEIVRQTRAAVGFLHRGRQRLALGGGPIAVGGSSAGGHLVGMLLAGGWHEAFGVPQDVVGTALALSGLHELEPLIHTHVNGWMGLDTSAARRNSPLLLIPQTSAAHLVASVGGLETTEFQRQTTEYAHAWRNAGHRLTTIAMPGHNHFDIALSLGEPRGALASAVAGLVGGSAGEGSSR